MCPSTATTGGRSVDDDFLSVLFAGEDMEICFKMKSVHVFADFFSGLLERLAFFSGKFVLRSEARYRFRKTETRSREYMLETTSPSPFSSMKAEAKL